MLRSLSILGYTVTVFSLGYVLAGTVTVSPWIHFIKALLVA